MSEVSATTKSRPGTALAVYDRIADPMAACKQMAKPVAALCNCSIDQGEAVMLACLCEGMNPMQFQRKYHLIQGKPSMRADAMLAAFRVEHGGKHKIVERTPEKASIVLINNEGEEFAAEYSWKDALESRWPWAKEKGPGSEPIAKNLKDNWSTPTDRRAMLWARVVSDSIRAFCPEIVSGVYTPEEMIDAIDGEFAVSPATNGQAAPKTSAMDAVKNLASKVATVVESAHAASDAVDEDVIEAEYVAAGESNESDPPFDAVEASPEDEPSLPASDAPDPSDTESEHDKPLGKGYATKSQIAKLRGLFEELGVSLEKQNQALKDRGVNAVRSLQKADCQVLIDKLEAVKKNNAAAAKN